MPILIKTISPKTEDYLASCARIRDITLTALITKLIETIAQDQLVLSILDDDSRPAPREKGKHGFREPRARKDSVTVKEHRP